jgi:hypothetical protein
MLSNNYVKLDKNFQSTGTFVHCAKNDEFMTITIQKCGDGDFENVDVNPNTIHVRLNIGKHSSLLYKFDVNNSTFVMKNIPIYYEEEAWIAISLKNTYCAVCFTHKKPM